MTDGNEAAAERLESLWEGPFGDAYTARNADVGAGRQAFWDSVLAEFPVGRVLEVGCNLGANLQWIAGRVPSRDVFGVDVNETALRQLRGRLPEVNAVWAKGRELPFRDGFFDLVFTCGVLIHQPPENLQDVMGEIVRCSRRYILAAEYFAERLTEVPYRGQSGVLFKADFGALYTERFPWLKLLRRGFLGRDQGWDDVTYWVFEKAS